MPEIEILKMTQLKGVALASGHDMYWLEVDAGGGREVALIREFSGGDYDYEILHTGKLANLWAQAILIAHKFPLSSSAFTVNTQAEFFADADFLQPLENLSIRFAEESLSNIMAMGTGFGDPEDITQDILLHHVPVAGDLVYLNSKRENVEGPGKPAAKEKQRRTSPPPIVLALKQGNPNWNHEEIPKAQRFWIDEANALAVQSALNRRKPLLIIGEPGTGKTTLAQCIAAWNDLPYTGVGASGNFDEFRLQGYQTIRDGEMRYVMAEFARRVEVGGLLHIDEQAFMPPEVLAFLNSLFDDRRELQLSGYDGRVIKAHPDLFIVVTQNPNDGRFAGQSDMNVATYDRFARIRLPYLDIEQEVEMLRTKCPDAQASFVREVVRLGRMVRESYRNGNFRTYWTPRSMINLIDWVTDGVPLDFAVRNTLVEPLARTEEDELDLREMAEKALTGLVRL